MKMIVLRIIILLIILISNISDSFSKENSNNMYVLVELQDIRNDIGLPSLYYTQFDIEMNNNKSKYIVKYLTRRECKKLVDEIMKEEKNNLKRIKKEKTAIGWQDMRVDRYYVMQPEPASISNYFCIPVRLWNNMQSYFKPNMSDYTIGIENVSKTNDSFFKIMSQCGLTDFGFNHINIHNIPFICDKYNEKNPVPFKTYEEIVNETR